MSIRTYIFALLTSFVLLIAVILSYQSARLFIGSFGMVIEDIMLQIGQEYPKNNQVEQTVLEYHVTTDWQKVPQPVRNYFPVIPKETEQLHSKFVDWAYIAPPKKIYSLLVLNRDGKQVFVSRFNESIHDEMAAEHKGDFVIDPMVIIILVGLSGIGVFVLVLLYVFKKIAVPVESLQVWGKQLTLSDLENKKPDFKFRELNELADIIHSNLASVAGSVQREQAFLSYASHELRTPIAVLRSNSALLEKVNPSPTDKEREIRDRIQRASLTMKSMTETLLWLSREGDIDMPIQDICLGELMQNSQAELRYLLAGKAVEVNICTDKTMVPIATVPTMIVLNNLVRNAFQHTQSGHVDILQRGNEVIINNAEHDAHEIADSKGELGFGLGMQLVEKLTTQFAWPFTVSQGPNGYHVTVNFKAK
ncbi:sensor histidine kinase [Cognaticolwellia mytili]|uniref:sensor histidine kinase n=1 Tax=Cognaticolwellia mytili TaxID=1888913 RepID=UPI000A1779D7|nr:HAMP domain-containing sensor histidine kinase [Cognaticolwellia mytili]